MRQEQTTPRQFVKQHGGSIEVDTQPGEFTEFRIVLPRGAATIAKSGARP